MLIWDHFDNKTENNNDTELSTITLIFMNNLLIQVMVFYIYALGSWFDISPDNLKWERKFIGNGRKITPYFVIIKISIWYTQTIRINLNEFNIQQ